MIIILLNGSAQAADVTTALDINSAYVWRGITFNDGIVFQPSVDITKGGFGLNVWGNIDGDDYDDTLDVGELSEVDITLSYGFDLKPVDITVGYIEYVFPQTEKTDDENLWLSSREIFVGFAMDLAAGFSAGLNVYYEFDDIDDFYTNLNLTYGTSLSEAVGLELGAAIGYAGEEYTADGDGGFFDYLLSAGIDYAVTDNLSLSAAVNYTDSVDEDKLPDQDTHFFGGIGAAYTF